MGLKLETIIRQYIRLPAHPNASGWYPCVHAGCDHGKKGNRAGFRFEGDGVIFRCFNCNTTTGYNPHEHKTIGEKMVTVLKDFGIPESEYQQVIFDNYGNKKTRKRQQRDLELEPKEISLPPKSYLLGSKQNDMWSTIAQEYLELDRQFDPKSYPFYLSEDKGWRSRLIIPIYKDNKLIYYVGRDLTDKQDVIKYKSANTPKSNVLYGFEHLQERTDAPLYVTEGFFDAFALNGVCVFGNEMTKQQIQLLNLCSRPKIIIPDRYGNGSKLALQAVKCNWAISLPEIGDCKDIDEAIRKYGRIYVLQSIVENTKIGFDAEVAIGVLTS